MDNFISILTKIKNNYESGQIKNFLAAKQLVQKDNIKISEDFDTVEIEQILNIINDYFNSDLYKEILIEESDNSENIKLLLGFLNGTQEKINNLLTDINENKFINNMYFAENAQTININDYVKQITLNADFFNFNYAAEFVLEIDGKKYHILPLNFEGQYIEEIKNGETKFNVNLCDEIYFYSETLNKINLALDEDYNIIKNKVNFNFAKTNSYSKIFIEYDPTSSSFFINLNSNIKNVKLIIDDKTKEVFGYENFFIKVKR